MLKLFGNSNKGDDKTLKAVRGKLKELFGEGTDAELLDKLMQLEKPDANEEDDLDDTEDDTDTDKAEETDDKGKDKKKTKTDDKAKEADDTHTEGEGDAPDKTEVASLKKAVATLQKKNAALEEKFEMLNVKVAALGKLSARKATGGEREVEQTTKKGEFTDKDAPKF